MDSYKKIETFVAKKYGKKTGTKKAVGDFMMDAKHAVNVKSNNLAKQNYSPNMISIKKMYKWVYESKNNLSFVFVDYEEKGGKIDVKKITELVPIEKINWDCLSIEAQGYGVIQLVGKLKVTKRQTKKEFYIGFLKAYEKYRTKEIKKHEKFKKTLIKDPNIIDW